MATTLSVLKKVIPLNCVHVEGWETVTRTVERYGEPFEVDEIHVHARPFRRQQRLCPECMRECERDGHRREGESAWRAPDLDGVPVYLMYRPQRIKCPEHGEVNEWLPWADGRSRFTAGFNDEAAWLACQMSRTAVSCFLGINWRTVGNCVKAAHRRIEPDVSARLRGLRAICVDETSYSKGHKYVTVVYDMDRNRVAWVRERHGKSVFEEFCRLLTEEERAAVEVVAGDGARWIDECVAEHFPNAVRCVDFFHVVQWANDALDKVRLSSAAKARRAYAAKKAELEAEEAEEARAAEEAARARAEAEAELAAMPRRGRPSRRELELAGFIRELDEAQSAREAAHGRRGPGRPRKGARLTPEHQRVLDGLADAAKAIKGAKHALGHNPENRTANQEQMLALIEAEQPDLWAAYQLKERLRLILHMRDAEEAAAQLDEWAEDASACGLAPMEELAAKIARHRESILNSVRLQANSAKSEACNTTIKALVKTARGFRNIDNMVALIYLKCSDLVVPLHNRPQPSAEWRKKKRDEANERRRAAKGLRLAQAPVA